MICMIVSQYTPFYTVFFYTIQYNTIHRIAVFDDMGLQKILIRGHFTMCAVIQHEIAHDGRNTAWENQFYEYMAEICMSLPKSSKQSNDLHWRSVSVTISRHALCWHLHFQRSDECHNASSLIKGIFASHCSTAEISQDLELILYHSSVRDTNTTCIMINHEPCEPKHLCLP